MINHHHAEKTVIPTMRRNISQNPHVVILGAGASIAAFGKGDKNGRSLPLMNSLVDTLSLNETLSEYRSLFNDFESLFTKLSQNKESQNLRETVEEATRKYFYNMEIQDKPTLYDYLFVSLREKDVIATFNWDSLLLQAMRRHSKFSAHMPQVLFLHGNVAVGVCDSCNILGYMYDIYCPRCHRPYKPMQLLYPVEKKDYKSEKYIKEQWEFLTYALERAYFVTIFGYSAPKTDVEARELILNAITKNKSRPFIEIDIIDVKSKREVESNWREFFYSHHYGIKTDVSNSYLWTHPRRSCDAHFSAYLNNKPWSYNRFPAFRTISGMHKWITPLINEEIEVKLKGIDFKISKT